MGGMTVYSVLHVVKMDKYSGNESSGLGLSQMLSPTLPSHRVHSLGASFFTSYHEVLGKWAKSLTAQAVTFWATSRLTIDGSRDYGRRFIRHSLLSGAHNSPAQLHEPRVNCRRVTRGIIPRAAGGRREAWSGMNDA
ncbi:hypothetical protein J6590_003790 [Homalodisca vitripennis]|nr:hypothetical protein J6590_003790 [Homalodisca vitripennis]